MPNLIEQEGIGKNSDWLPNTDIKVPFKVLLTDGGAEAWKLQPPISYAALDQDAAWASSIPFTDR
jgi:hypothetical protein